MLTSRRLTFDDKIKFQNLVIEKCTGLELYQEYVFFSKYKIDEYLDQDQSEKVLFGTFDGDNLIATLGMVFNAHSPTWLLVLMIASKPSFGYNLNANGLAGVMELALDLAESKQVYKYFTFIKKSTLHLSHDKWFTYVPRLKNYSFVIEEIIPSGTKSKYITHQAIAYNKTYSEDYLIRSATASDDIRVYKHAYNKN
jgi:hypothetical protein